MKKFKLFRNLMVFALFFGFFCFASAQTTCDSNCANGIYTSGYYDTGFQRCSYYQTACAAGCNAQGTACNAECTDSDSNNIYTKGTVVGWDYYKTQILTVNDSCTTTYGGAETSSGNWVVEELCDSEQKAHAYYYLCPSGYSCSAGKCIQQTTATQCSDADGSDIYTKTTSTGLDYYGTQVISSSDYCTQSNGGAQTTTGQWVAEEQCDADGKLHAYYYQCPSGYSCSDGKCVYSTTSTPLPCPDYCSNGTAYSNGYYDTGFQRCSYTQTACSTNCNEMETACDTYVPPANESRCGDYCEAGVYYSSGFYDTGLQRCLYNSTALCANGCSSTITGCETASDAACPTYCRDNMTKYNGYYDTRLHQCEYEPMSCRNGCNAQGTECNPIDTSCPDKCRNNWKYYNGYYNLRLFQCEYERDSCDNGCNANATGCVGDENGTTTTTTTTTTNSNQCNNHCENGIYYTNGFYDTGLQRCNFTQINCPTVCNAEGTSCGIPLQSCTDTDGDNLYTKGTVTGWDSSGTTKITVDDGCTDSYGGAEIQSGKWVVEQKCDSENKAHAYYYLCPTTGGCVDGKCTGETNATVYNPNADYGSDSNRAGGTKSSSLPMTLGGGKRFLVIETGEGVEMQISGQTVVLRKGTEEFSFERNFEKMATANILSNEFASSAIIAIDQNKPIYAIDKLRKGMALGIIPVDMPIMLLLNAADLSVIGELKPWWSFLVFDTPGTATEWEISIGYPNDSIPGIPY